MGARCGMLQSNLGSKYDITLSKFTEEFPPMSVYRGRNKQQACILQPGSQILVIWDEACGPPTVEEMLLIDNSNKNPA